MTEGLPTSPARKILGLLASLKVAIPLLVITVVVTVAGSLLPTPDFFSTWWYLTLLGLNGISLLFVTILHIPVILQHKGRSAMIGVVVTHLGILVLIVGIIYGGISGFRYEVNVIEGEMAVVPGLSFVVFLDDLVVEEYVPNEVVHIDPEFVPKKRQESHLAFYKKGELIGKSIAAPGNPARLDGMTILPAFDNIGWVFELLVIDGIRGHQKAVSVRPWVPTVIDIAGTQVMVHGLKKADKPAAQLFTLDGGQMILLGVVEKDRPVAVNGSPVEMGEYRRYTGLAIYKRPQAPVLVAGCLLMLVGLVWHFYFRHRDRRGQE